MRLFRFKYHKLTGLVVAIILAYFVFSNSYVENFVLELGSLSYFGHFIAGMLFSFGFTSPFAVGFFIVSNPSNIIISALIGGGGALISDLFIFKFVKDYFKDEFSNISKTKPIKEIRDLIDKNLGRKIRLYLLYVFAGILIASPLPDEAGVIMLAGLTKIKIKTLAIISYLFNSLGILIFFLI